jgi:GNAT superfamily N-acetyltransferase
MFADTALAAQIEAAEARLCADIAARAAATRPAVRPIVRALCGGTATFAGLGSPVNKAIGVAMDRPLAVSELAEAEEAWRERGEPFRVELATLAHPSAAPLLTARGYRLVTFENVLGRPLAALEPIAPNPRLRIEPIAASDHATWADVVVDGFAHPDEGPAPAESYPRDVLEAVFDDLAGATGFHRYLAHLDGAPAGAASLRIDGAVAQLAGAATLPNFRRRGVQTALLQRRLSDAHEAGCGLAVITTQPGSKSQANAQRRGFVLLYARAILVREWTTS